MASSQLIERYGNSNPTAVADAFALMKSKNKAFEWIEKLRQAGDPACFGIKSDVNLINLHDDSRWAKLVQELRFPD